jgi:steroid 5-alpha reductase family enzyme
MPRPLAVVVAAYALALFVALVAGAGAAAAGAHPIAVAALADVAATVSVFAFSFAFRNSSLYDPYWSVAPLALGLWFAAAGVEGAPPERRALVLALVLVWGARLTWNWWRGWTGLEHEDWRYVRIQEQTGRAYWLASFFGIHLFPTLIVLAGCLPLWPALGAGARPLGALDALAFAVTAGAIALEAGADEQLRRFRESPDRPPGGIIDTGLWSWSRHPNYLGEMGFWWGLWLFGVAGAPAAWWWTLVGPLAVTGMFVLGTVPMMERRMSERAGWPDHAARISRLLPRPPRP